MTRYVHQKVRKDGTLSKKKRTVCLRLENVTEDGGNHEITEAQRGRERRTQMPVRYRARKLLKKQLSRQRTTFTAGGIWIFPGLGFC